MKREIEVRIANTAEARSVLRRLVNHCYARALDRSPTSEAYRDVAIALSLSLEPEQLLDEENLPCDRAFPR